MIQQEIRKLSSQTAPYLTMYFVLKGSNGPEIRLVDLDKKVKEDFAGKFSKYLIDNYGGDNLVVGNVSDADDRKYDVLNFDIEIVQPLDLMEKLLKKPDAEKYVHSSDKNLVIDGYIFLIGNNKIKMAFYKEHYSVDSITRESFLVFGRSNSRFVEVKEDEIFRLSNKIDFLLVNGKLYVLNMRVMETNFKVHDVLKNKAEIFIKEINQKGFVENPEFINQNIQENPTFARKVLKVNKESPVINLTFKQIKSFVQGHPHLKGRLRFNVSGDKFSLDTKTSAKLFIKLMDDDFLRSDLSQNLYDSVSKDMLNNENNDSVPANSPKKKNK